jgi:hypothetical protein
MTNTPFELPRRYQIVNTDNFGGDYPNERFVENLPAMNKKQAEVICSAINSTLHPSSARWYRVVPEGYVLQPGFEP